MIHFDKVHLRFDTGISLRDLNFRIQKKEFVYLYGPSGSGKSSILKMIYMDLFPNDGQVMVFNQDSSVLNRRDIAGVRQRIGMVFQDFKLLSDRDVHSNIALPLEMQGLKSGEIQQKVVQITDELGIRTKLSHFPHELSEGEQQKVVLARAIINTPDIILADEPTAHLDEKASAEVMAWLWGKNAEGITVIFATHKEHFLKQEPSRTISLSSGEIIQDRKI